MLQNLIEKLLKNVSNLYNSSGFKGRIARGGVWLGGGAGTEHGLRLIRNMILTRILAPEAFGLMAMVLAVNTFFESFTQIGIREAVIQNPKGNEDTFLNGAFWLSFVRGIILLIFAIITVPWIAHFYDSPELVPMMRVAFLSIFFIGAISPKAYSSLKLMNYKKWVIVIHGGSVIGILTAISLGFLWQNVWALVVGFTVENVARCIISYIVCPFVPRFNFEKESLQSLFRFARGMLGLPILVFLYNKIDIFVLGKLCSKSEVGLYSIAFSLVQAPFLIFTALYNPILLPVFSSIQHDNSLLKEKFLKSSKFTVLFFLPLLTLMAITSSQLLSFIYGEIYAAMSFTFIILCGSLAIKIIGSVMVILLLAIGKPQFIRAQSIKRFIVMMVIIVPLVQKFEAIGAALASLISGLVWLLYTFKEIKKEINLSIRMYLNSLKLGAIISLFLVVVVLLFYNTF